MPDESASAQRVDLLTYGQERDKHVLEAEALARSDGFERLRDTIVRLARTEPDDVGAGTGLLTLALAPRVAEVCAIDISAAMLDHLAMKAAAADLDNVDTALANPISLPLADESATRMGVARSRSARNPRRTTIGHPDSVPMMELNTQALWIKLVT